MTPTNYENLFSTISFLNFSVPKFATKIIAHFSAEIKNRENVEVVMQVFGHCNWPSRPNIEKFLQKASSLKHHERQKSIALQTETTKALYFFALSDRPPQRLLRCYYATISIHLLASKHWHYCLIRYDIGYCIWARPLIVRGEGRMFWPSWV